MQKCAYYNCTQFSEEDFRQGFLFCGEHLWYLHELIEFDLENNSDVLNVVAYCLSAINGKLYQKSLTVL